jgi:hypothetical protein
MKNTEILQKLARPLTIGDVNPKYYQAPAPVTPQDATAGAVAGTPTQTGTPAEGAATGATPTAVAPDEKPWYHNLTNSPDWFSQLGGKANWWKKYSPHIWRALVGMGIGGLAGGLFGGGRGAVAGGLTGAAALPLGYYGVNQLNKQSSDNSWTEAKNAGYMLAYTKSTSEDK